MKHTQKNHLSGRFHFALVPALLLLGALASPAYSEDKDKRMAEEDGVSGTFSIGAGGVGLDRDSFKFGEYSGLEKGDGIFVGDADIAYNRKSYYMNFFSTNLGLENRSIYLESGKRGDYNFFAGFDQTPHLLSNNSQTVYHGTGTSNLTLPSSFTAGGQTTNMTILERNSLELQTERDTATFGFFKSFGENDFTVTYKREDKDGIRPLGMSFNQRSVIIPETLDQDVNELSMTFAHNGEDRQIKFQYFLSLFDNRVEALKVDGPFTGQASVGLISRAPDNRYHRLSLSGGWNLGETTRISGMAEYGVMLQDDNFFPYATIAHTARLPRNSADARIHTTHVMFNVDSRPIPELSLNAKYKHYQTINDIQRTLLIPVSVDNTLRADDSAQAHYNTPLAYAQDNLQLDTSYRVFKATTLKLGYEGDLWNRSFREAETTMENTFKAGLRSNYFSFASTNLKFSYGRKIQDKNDMAQTFRNLHSPNYLSANPEGSDSNPNLVRVDVKNRERINVGGNINFTPIGNFAAGVSYNLREDDYGHGLGVEYVNNQNATLDVNYTPSDRVSYYGFYTYGRQRLEQAGAESVTDATRDYWRDENDVSHTFGVGANGRLLKNKLDLSTEYTYTQSVTDITFTHGGAAVAGDPTALPDLANQRHRFEFKGDYKYTPKISVGLKYIAEVYRDDNFATDGFDPASNNIADLLLLDGSEQDYTAHLALVFLTYKIGN